MGFFRQEYWSGLPCSPAGNLPDPRIKPASLTSPAWQVGSLPLVPPGKPHMTYVSWPQIPTPRVDTWPRPGQSPMGSWRKVLWPKEHQGPDSGWKLWEEVLFLFWGCLGVGWKPGSSGMPHGRACQGAEWAQRKQSWVPGFRGPGSSRTWRWSLEPFTHISQQIVTHTHRHCYIFLPNSLWGTPATDSQEAQW